MREWARPLPGLNIAVILAQAASGNGDATSLKDLLGDCVKIGIHGSVYELMEFYRMAMGTHRPGVEYMPVAPPGGPQQRR